MGRTSKDLIEEQLDGLDASIKLTIKNLIDIGCTKQEACEYVGEYMADYDTDVDALVVPGEEET